MATVFYDDFNRADSTVLGNGWEQEDGAINPQISGGVVINTGASVLWMSRSIPHPFISFRCRVNPPNTFGSVLVVLYDDESNSVEFLFDESSLDYNGSTYPIAGIPSDGSWATVSVSVSGDVSSVLFDGSEVLSADISTYLNTESVTLAVLDFSGSSRISVDDFTVYDIATEPDPEPDPEPEHVPLHTLPWRGWFGASDELFTAGWFVQSDRLLAVPVRFSVDSSVTLRYTAPRGDIGWFSRPPSSGAWTEIESEALPWTNSTTTVEAEWTVRETEPTDPVTRPAEGA